MKFFFSILSVFLAVTAGMSQSFWKESGDCNSKSILAQVDSLVALVRTDDQLQAIEFANNFLISLEKNHLEECEVYYKTLLEQAKAYSRDVKLDKALQLLHALLSKIKNKGLNEIEAFTYIEIALVHEFYNNWSECKSNLDIAFDLVEKHDLTEAKPQYYVRISSYTRFRGSQGEAYNFAVKAIEAAVFADDPYHELEGYLMKGITAKNQNEAVENLAKTAELFGKFGDHISQASQFLNIASILTLSNEIGKNYLDYARIILESEVLHDKDYYSILSYYNTLKRDYFLDRNKVDSAFVYSELSFAAERKAMITENSQKVAFEILELHLEEMRNTLSKSEEDKTLFQRYFITAIVVLTIFTMMFFLFYGNRQKVLRQSKVIEEKNLELKTSNEKNAMLLSEVHHRVKNNLQNIIGLIHLKQSQLKDPRQGLFMDDISTKIFSMSLIHEQLYQEREFANVKIKNYVQSLIDKFKSIITSELQIKFDLQIDETSLNVETTMPLGIIITELITNSIKHNFTKKDIVITISFQKIGDLYELEYHDNGIGFESNREEKKGTGLNIIKGLSRQLRGAYLQEGENGFKAKLSFKEKQVSQI